MQIQVIRLFLGDTIFVLVAWLSVCRAKHSLWPGLLTHLERFTITFSCAGNVLERGLPTDGHWAFDIRYRKTAFWPNLCVGRNFLILEILGVFLRLRNCGGIALGPKFNFEIAFRYMPKAQLNTLKPLPKISCYKIPFSTIL